MYSKYLYLYKKVSYYLLDDFLKSKENTVKYFSDDWVKTLWGSYWLEKCKRYQIRKEHNKNQLNVTPFPDFWALQLNIQQSILSSGFPLPHDIVIYLLWSIHFLPFLDIWREYEHE